MRSGIVSDHPFVIHVQGTARGQRQHALALIRRVRSRHMRYVPVSLELVRTLATAAALPMLPLLLFRYPLAELVKQFFVRLTGL
jgi:hypothetical protein